MVNNDKLVDRKVVLLQLDDILPNRFQPRIKFDEQALYELSQSIKEHGVLSPITVRPLGNKYEIIAGERRYKASLMAGLATIPAMVVNMDDKESAEIALIENVQRKDLTPIEEAISYKKIFDMNIGISQETLAKKLGKSQSAIANKLRLLNLSDEAQEALLEGKISERHARSLLRIKDKKTQNLLLNKIIKERLTVRKTDEEIINMLNTNKDIEILDFELENESERKEQIDTPLNRFENLYNMPKSQIIEDKEDEFIPKIPDVKISEVTELPKQNVVSPEPNNDVLTNETLDHSSAETKDSVNLSSNINPGFLDISKIEQEASDINSNSNKISLEELLKSPNTNDNLKNSSDELDFNFEERKVPPTSNRFFTMLEEENESNDSTDVQGGDSLITNQKSDPLQEDSVKEKMDNNLNFDAKFIPQENNIFHNIDNLDKIEESKDEKINFSFDNDIFSKPITENDSLSDQTVTNNSSEEFDMNSGLNSNALNETKLEESESTNDKEDIFKPLSIEEEIKVEIPKQDIIEDEDDNTSLQEMSPVPNISETISPVPPMDYTPVYDLDDEKEDDFTIAEKHTDNSKYGAADLKTIINTIRKCAETIEKYGYVIDTEEFDFEDMYQVIFKVQKKQ